MSETHDVVRGIMEMLADTEARLGRTVDWEKHLPPGKEAFTAREVCNAVGAALTDAGLRTICNGTMGWLHDASLRVRRGGKPGLAHAMANAPGSVVGIRRERAPVRVSPRMEGDAMSEPRGPGEAVGPPVITAEAWNQWLDAARREASVTTAMDFPLLSVSAETKAFWKANAGNAKARRRWRRRNLRNSQTPRGTESRPLLFVEM